MQIDVGYGLFILEYIYEYRIDGRRLIVAK